MARINPTGPTGVGAVEGTSFGETCATPPLGRGSEVFWIDNSRGLRGVRLIPGLRPRFIPRRCSFPITELRDTPPSSSAICDPLSPSSTNSFFSLAIRSSLQSSSRMSNLFPGPKS